MIKATLEDKPTIIDILVKSFEKNKSVNYIIKQDNQRWRRIESLMAYSFYSCLRFGDIFLSDDRKGCALILYPDKQKTDFESMLSDLKLAFVSIGAKNIVKTLKRESEIKKRHPKEPFAYLWFIGVAPQSQGKGTGSLLLQEVLEHAKARERTVFLETSTLVNLPWYEKYGFHIYDEVDLGYKLFFLKHA